MSVLDFPVEWYVREVGMPQGLVKPLLRQAEMMLRKRHHGRSEDDSRRLKRARVADENIDPTLRN